MAARPLLLLIIIIIITATSIPPSLSDPTPTQDICVADTTSTHTTPSGHPCKPLSAVTSSDFYFPNLSHEPRTPNNTTSPWGLTITHASVTTFPGLNTIGLSAMRIDLAPGGIVPIHSHPRSSELVMVLRGKVSVGFITSLGQVFSKVLRRGEIFVVPRGLMHFQENLGSGRASLMPVFEAMEPGMMLAPVVLFGSAPELPTSLLAKTFMMEEKDVESLKYKFGGV